MPYLINASRLALRVLLVTMLLGGCSTGVFIQHDPMREALADLQSGVHTRDDVTTLLGNPAVSMPERGVDVFQRSGDLTDVMLPGVGHRTEWTYYTLISYDRAGLLTGIDTGGYVYRSNLKADRFRYHMGQPGALFEQELAPAFTTPGDGCTLIFVVIGDRWSDALYFRDPIRLNGSVLRGPPDYSSYSYRVVEPGSQTLSVTWGGRRGPWSRELDFNCTAGELRYVTLAAERRDAPIQVGADVPPELPGRALLLHPPRTAAPVLER